MSDLKFETQHPIQGRSTPIRDENTQPLIGNTCIIGISKPLPFWVSDHPLQGTKREFRPHI